MTHISFACCLIALAVAGCAAAPSSVTLSDLTRQVVEDIERFETWVAADQARDDAFPVGLCLARIDLKVSVADTRTTGGTVGLPLAAPASPIGATLSFFGSTQVNKASETLVPFVPEYQGDAPDPARAEDLQRKLNTWVASVRTPSKSIPDTWSRLPPETSQEQFDQDTSLAAELWRIRAAIHRSVLQSAQTELDYFLRPGPIEHIRRYEAVNIGGGSVAINVGSSASLSANTERSKTSSNIMKIKHVENLSIDQFACDSTSLELQE